VSAAYRLVVPALLTLAVFIVLVALGNWQMRRLEWKEGQIASATERPFEPVQDLPHAPLWKEFDIAANQYRAFRFTGRFLHDKEALVFTSLSDGTGPFAGPGFWVMTPFALESGGTVLVNRGFAPQGRHLPQARGEQLNSAVITVTGLLRPDDPPNFLTPENRPEANQFYSRSIEAITAAKGLSGPVAPFAIDLPASATPPGGLPQAGETRMVFSNNHLSYALTWYGLAAALLAVFASFVRGRLREGSQGPSLTRPGGTP
jgi:surfeit locus 1 family protein